MVAIRVANKQDVPAVKRLMQSVPGFWQAGRRSDVIERGIDSADGLAFVAEVQGEIVGFVCAHDVGFRAYLSELVVAESQRGQGVGKQLVKQVEQTAATRGCHVIFSDVWQDAESFYRHLGWSAPDVVLLRKKLE